MLAHPLPTARTPYDIAFSPGLQPDAKRAILASWASDAFAVESAPALRKPPELNHPVPIDDVLGALRILDDAHPTRRTQ